MQMLIEFFPIILFFAAYRFGGIFFATAAAVAAGLGQIAYSFARRRRVEPAMWINVPVLLVFGGLTLVLRNELFIKWKPSILYWSFAVAFGAARLAFGKNLIRTLLRKNLSLPDRVWERLNLAWTAFFAGLGALNLFVAYRFPTGVWVNFKLFGLLGCMLAFILGQSLFIAPYVRPDTGPSAGQDGDGRASGGRSGHTVDVRSEKR